MPSKPCASNDSISIIGRTNDSDGSNDSRPLLDLTNQRGQGSGCDEYETAAVEEEEEQILGEKLEPVEEEQIFEEPLESVPVEEEQIPEEEATAPIAFISCHSANAQDLTDANGIERIDLAYDYEIHTTDEADLFASVNAFEVDLLKALAEEYNLSNCESGRRSLLRSNVEQRKLVDTEFVVGAGSYLGDVVDSIHTECVSNVDSIESSSCTPINGYMTAWVSNSEEVRRRLSQRDIYSIIEKYSDSYTNSDGVLAVSYIGTRPEEDASKGAVLIVSSSTKNDGNPKDLAASSNTMSPGVIAGVSVASIFALLAILAMVIKNHRNRRDADDEALSLEIVNDALFMENDDDEFLKVVNDDSASSTGSDDTEDYAYAETIAPSGTFESVDPSECGPSDEVGFEVSVSI